MVPTMIFDAAGKPIVAFGSPGGATIINSVFNVTLNLLDHGMTIQQAIDAPRISATSVSGTVGIDVGNPSSPTPFPAASITGLRNLGHNVGNPADIGSVQAVVVDAQTGKQYGAADARREGTVIGLARALGGHYTRTTPVRGGSWKCGRPNRACSSIRATSSTAGLRGTSARVARAMDSVAPSASSPRTFRTP
jgi:hypothetical protein